ncbi:MAG: hypothetical protein IKU84_01350 [Clostridia bacterium]|nr:hypothetical protein [Clostridia bacterium]
MKWLSRTIYILVFLVMVTSPYAGHTYAEYAREASGSDTARISNFGVFVTATQSSFAVSYTNVQSSNSNKVIAPGTSGTFVAFTTTGKAEVRTKVTQTPTLTMSDNWTDANGKFYCPLVFTVTDKSGTTVMTINGLDYNDKASFVTALTNALTVSGQVHDPGYNYSNSTAHNRTVTWEWPYIGATGSNTNGVKQDEPSDNSLGAKKPTISIACTLTIEQIQ